MRKSSIFLFVAAAFTCCGFADFLPVDDLGIGFEITSGGHTLSCKDADSSQIRDILGAKELEWRFKTGYVRAYLNPAECGGWRYLPLKVDLGSEFAVLDSITYPILKIDRKENSRLLFSDVWGAQGSLIRPIWEKVNPGDIIKTTKDSPGFRFASVLNENSPSVYVDSREEDFSPIRFSFVADPNDGNLLVSVVHPQPGSFVGGVIKSFTGGWYAAARLYKSWVSKTMRFAKAKERSRGKLRNVSMWFWNRGLSDDVIAPVEKFQRDAGVPAALNWYWWHEIPYDSGYPNFWPPREGVAAFRAAVERLNKAEIFAQAYMNGMTWDCDDPSWTHGGVDDAVLPLHAVTYNVYDCHRLANLCGESPHFQRLMRHNVDELINCGLDGIYLDMISAASLEALCRNPNHAHRPGEGAAQVRGWRKFVDEIKAQHPGVLVSSEDAGDSYYDVFDFLICCFPSYERFGFGVAPERECVPVFSAVYHEAIPMFGSYALIDGIPPWDPKWPDENRWKDELPWERLFPDQFAVELSRGLVWGLQPTVNNFHLSAATDVRYAADYRFMIDVARFHHENRDLLFDGEMLAPGRLECATKAVDFLVRGIYAKEGDFKKVCENALPAVFHSVWRAPDGRKAAVLVNWTREEQSWHLDTPDVKGKGILPPRSLRVVDAVRPVHGAVVIERGEAWLPFEYRKDVAPGSALDLSTMGFVDAPAGKHGPPKVVDGHFVFERLPDVKQRFYGVNICGEMVAPSHEQADLLVSRLVKAGYNSVRVHHHDSVLCRNSPDGVSLDTEAMERFDYLFAKAKAAGLYFTTDVFVSRPVKWREIGEDRDGFVDMSLLKGLFLVNPKAYRNWKAYAKNFFNHVNPYTGLSYAEDPAMSFVSLVNEGAFAWRRGLFDRDETRALYRKWLARMRKKNPFYDPDAPEDCLGHTINVQGSKGYWALMTFVRDIEAHFARSARDYLRSLGVKAILTDWNCGPYLRNTAVMDNLDYVDTHAYVNHPVFIGDKKWAPPAKVGNASPAEAKKDIPVWLGGLAHNASKPFTVSEWAYVTPGAYRSSAGLLFGGVAAKLDWDALWRFDYAWSGGELVNPTWLAFFSVNADPFARFTDYAAVMAFLGRALEPVSYTGKAVFPLFIDDTTGRFTVSSERLCGGFAREGDALSAGALSWQLEKSDATLWAASLDGLSLSESSRIVLFHLTDLKAEGMAFADSSCEALTNWGGDKLVVRVGRAAVRLKVNPKAQYELWALESDGTRKKRLTVEATGGELIFELDVKGADGKGRCVYEIVKTAQSKTQEN